MNPPTEVSSARGADGKRPAYPFALSRLVAPGALVESLAANRLVIGGVDGSHMGLAINWWEADVAAVCGRAEGSTIVDDIKRHVDASEALRSAIEVILEMVDWIARNDRESNGDRGVRVLNGLAGGTLLLPSQRILCADLAQALDEDPEATDITIHRVDVESAMRLLVFLSRAIEQRFGVSVDKQIATFRASVLLLEGGHRP